VVPPIVRQMIVCDDMMSEIDSPSKLNAHGLAHAISPQSGDRYPLKHPQLSAFLLITGGVGSGLARVVVRSEESGLETFASSAHEIENPTERNRVEGYLFRVTDCVFDKPGFYWVEFEYEGMTLAQQPLLLRPQS